MPDVIEEIMKQQAEIPPQLKLVANYYSYDSDVLLFYSFLGKFLGKYEKYSLHKSQL